MIILDVNTSARSMKERKYKRENIACTMLSLEEVNCFADDCRELTIITKRARIDEI